MSTQNPSTIEERHCCLRQKFASTQLSRGSKVSGNCSKLNMQCCCYSLLFPLMIKNMQIDSMTRTLLMGKPNSPKAMKSKIVRLYDYKNEMAANSEDEVL